MGRLRIAMSCADAADMDEAPMAPAARKLLLVKPGVAAPLDPDFAPIVLGRRRCLEAVKASPGGGKILHMALERPGGLVARVELPVFADDHPDVEASIHLACTMIRTYMWQRGGHRLQVSGPPEQCKRLKAALSPGGCIAWDAKEMTKACGQTKPFEVEIVADPKNLPADKNVPVQCGREATGSRLAFDLGKSDMKAVAVKDGKLIWSKETEWDVTNKDPLYHKEVIRKAMREAATHVDKVEAVGGASCGIVSGHNELTSCDLFTQVPDDVYREKVPNLLIDLIKEEFGDVPFKCINDGEVTAVAGQMMIGEGGLYGISLGSNEGCGYVDPDGNLPGWINEMYATPLDFNPAAPRNPWTPYTGDSPMYLGQRAVSRNAVKGGVDVPEEMRFEHSGMRTMNHVVHAECLKLVQAAMKDPTKEPRTRKIYETIGVYLGYTIANYCEIYKPYAINHVLILGRVTSGTGGEVMMAKAQEVLKEFPEFSHVKFHTPDEHMKRVGQCLAAAALPPLKKQRTA